MRRSRSLASTLAVVALPLLVSACGDDDDTAGTTSGTEASGGMSGGMSGMSDDMGMDGHGEASDVAEGARRIEVTAMSFEFDPAEITVTAGEDIAIVLTADDTLHDFTIDELDAHVAADAGQTEEGGFRADEPGTYTFYCTVSGHREAGMEGTVVVEEA